MNAAAVRNLVESQLLSVCDDRVINAVRTALTDPHAMLFDWDYGAPGQQYLCWVVLDDEGSAIAYCDQGFGPHCPWGLVSSQGGSMGMDSGWYPSFMAAYFESAAATELAIWRVFLKVGGAPDEPLTGELSWEAAWQHCYAARKSEPLLHFRVNHSIAY